MKLRHFLSLAVLMVLLAPAHTPARAQGPLTSPDGPQPSGVTGASSCATTSLPRSFDGGNQTVAYFIPSPAPSNKPLIVALHGSGATGLDLCNFLAMEADARDWFIVAPDTVGRIALNHGLPSGRYNYGWIGAQRDVIDSINHMRANYSIDASHIYAIGNSMGGQMTTLMLAKYPDVFAAAATWSAVTDLTIWHGQLIVHPKLDGSTCTTMPHPLGPYCLDEYVQDEVGGTPAALPFDYQRRSPLQMAANLRLIPLKMWHHQLDTLVPIAHSTDLRNAVNATNPPVAVTVQTVTDSISCDPGYRHCWNPNPSDLFNFVQTYTRNGQPPALIQARTDESKAFHWLNIAQTGSPHWSHVVATYTPLNQSVTLGVTDTATVEVGINLGTVAIPGAAGLSQPGLGLNHPRYRVAVGANPATIMPYASGYLTVTVSAGQSAVTISPYYPVYLPVVSKNP